MIYSTVRDGEIERIKEIILFHEDPDAGIMN